MLETTSDFSDNTMVNCLNVAVLNIIRHSYAVSVYLPTSPVIYLKNLIALKNCTRIVRKVPRKCNKTHGTVLRL